MLNAPRSAAGIIELSANSTRTGSVSSVSPSRLDSAQHVCVDRQTRQTESLAAHHVGGLPAHTGERHQILHPRGHLAAETSDHPLRHPDQTARLAPEEPGRADQLLELGGIGGGERSGTRVAREERGRREVDPLVGALRGEDGRHEELEGVGVVERGQLLRGAGEHGSETLVRQAGPPFGRPGSGHGGRLSVVSS